MGDRIEVLISFGQNLSQPWGFSGVEVSDSRFITQFFKIFRYRVDSRPREIENFQKKVNISKGYPLLLDKNFFLKHIIFEFLASENPL